MQGLEVVELVKGKEIRTVVIKGESEVKINFTDGHTLSLQDNRQSCCESRYISTDDDVNSFGWIGATLLDVVVADGPEIRDKMDVHATQFLRVYTSKGVIVFVNHVEHNGYYGGFEIEATVIK